MVHSNHLIEVGKKLTKYAEDCQIDNVDVPYNLGSKFLVEVNGITFEVTVENIAARLVR